MSELSVRQYLHNDGSGFILGYDKSEVDEVVAELRDEIKRKEGVEKRWFERCMEARAENERMKARIAELEEERRWRKCSEELPEDGAEVLATDGDGIWLCYKTTMSDAAAVGSEGEECLNIT